VEKKEIIHLAIKYVTDSLNEKECNTILNLSFKEGEWDIFLEAVKALSAKRA